MNTWEALSVPMEAQMFALQVAISGAVVSGLVLLAGRLLRRRSAPLRYGVLLAGVFGLLAVPTLVAVGLNLPLLPASEEIVKISAEMLPAFLNQTPPEDEPAVEAASSALGDTAGAMLLIAWAFFAVVGLARLCFQLWKQQRRIVGRPWSPPWWTDERRTVLAEKVGLARFPAVRVSPIAPMPMVVGLLRPKIVLPELAPTSWGQPQWEAVLLHEAAHIARRDPWAALAQCLAVILFWWCPQVHLLARRLNDLREAICDDYALEGPCDRLAYAELLVESAERLVNLRALPIPVGLIDSARGGLEERITRLLTKEKEPMKKLSLAGKLLGASFLVAACLSITAGTAFTQTPPPKRMQIKIAIDGMEIDVDGANLASLLQALQPKPKPEAAQKETKKPDDAIQFKFFLDDIHGETTKPGNAAKAWKIIGDQFATTPPQPGDASQPKTDPRIDELVRAAEAIKPGSGADVRRALEAKPKPAQVRDVAQAPNYLATLAARVKGNHVIVVTIDAATGKVIQVTDTDTKKAPEKIRQDLKLPVKPDDPAGAQQENLNTVEALLKALRANGIMEIRTAPPVTPPPAALPAPAPKNPFGQAAPPAPKPPIRVAPPLPPTPDVDALARQLERITRELQELRQRLDANKN